MKVTEKNNARLAVQLLVQLAENNPDIRQQIFATAELIANKYDLTIVGNL